MSRQSDTVEAAAAQRNGARRATLSILAAKQPKRDDFSMPLGPDGEEISFLYIAIGAHAYDDLLTKHPPTVAQRAAGASFNSDTFGPALLARVCKEPSLDDTEWTEIWNSDNWGRGEVTALFWRAVELCNKDVIITPTGAG